MAAVSFEELRDQLRAWREGNLRVSEEIVETGEMLLNHYEKKLGNEVWIVYEQVCIAALDCGKRELAHHYIQCLKTNFPSSIRVRKLEGMALEAMERYQEACKIYQGIIEEDESNMTIRKRIVAVLKAQNKIPDAIDELNEYLKSFMSDQDAWMELCDLYIEVQEYGKAAYCMEEVLLNNPHNHFYNQKYAEIRYTQGGVDNLQLASKYFSRAAKLNPDNMRALYGLYITSYNLSMQKGGAIKRDSVKYADWAAQQIADRYKKQSRKDKIQLGAVEGMLEKLAITSGN